MATGSKKRKFTSSKKRFIGKPTGKIQERVQAVGPEHFGVVAGAELTRHACAIRSFTEACVLPVFSPPACLACRSCPLVEPKIH